MRIDEHFSSINVLSAVLKGCGQISFNNSARLAAMMIEHANAALAESLSIELKTSFYNDDLIISLYGLEFDGFFKLFQACLNTNSECEDFLFKRLEDELKLEKSDFDKQALKGYKQALLGIKNDTNLPNGAQLNEYFKFLKSAPVNFCLSLAKSKLSLITQTCGRMQLDFSAKCSINTDEFAKLERHLEHKIPLNINREHFSLHQKCSANQTFMYFGAHLGKFDLTQRAYAEIVSTAFGAGFSSRLTELIRVQNGLAYSAFAKITYLQNEAYWLGLMQTQLSNEAKAKEMISKLFSELKNGLETSEFDAAKSYLLSSFVLMHKDYLSKHRLMLSLLSSGLSEDFYERLQEQIEQASLEQVNEFLQSIATEASFYVVSANADIK